MGFASLWTASCVLAAGAGQQYQFTEVAGAQPDECFNGVGQPYIAFDNGCPSGTDPKRNHTYPWSLTSAGDKVYIGTGANVSCFGAAAVAGGTLPFIPGMLVCEGEQSQFPFVPLFLMSIMGDWRPPQVWCYDTITGTQTEITPADPRILQTMGMRAAGNADGVLLMGGPSVYGLGIRLFAWNLNTGNYIGSWASGTYSDVRKMVSVNGELYIGVQRALGGQGAILRWTGNQFLPFFFETVGLVDNDATYLIEHQGQLVVGTWPPTPLGSALGGFVQDFPPAGLWVSPPIPPGGLNWFHQFTWRKVFSIDEYEPDPVIARSYLIGEPVSFGGWVLFGTMNAPGTGALELIEEYGPSVNTPETLRNAYRALSFFRIQDLGPSETPHVELLYGYRRMNRFDPVLGWRLVDNNLGGVAPLHGQAGFGNPYNSYLWSSAVALGKAFVGTLDSGFFAGSTTPGADLFCFSDPDLPAQLVHNNGLTSSLNLGLRNMIGAPDILYVGAMNLFNLAPTGGWKLIEVLED